jgi:hypothetical protein
MAIIRTAKKRSKLVAGQQTVQTSVKPSQPSSALSKQNHLKAAKSVDREKQVVTSTTSIFQAI